MLPRAITVGGPSLLGHTSRAGVARHRSVESVTAFHARPAGRRVARHERQRVVAPVVAHRPAAPQVAARELARTGGPSGGVALVLLGLTLLLLGFAARSYGAPTAAVATVTVEPTRRGSVTVVRAARRRSTRGPAPPGAPPGP